MSEELKQCPTPWCAHPRPTLKTPRWGGWYVKCYGCDVRGRHAHERSDAIAAWNTRPVEDELRAENQRLREALEPLAKAADEHDAEKLRNGYVHDYDYSPDDEPLTVHGSGSLTVGDARRARAALKEPKR